MPASKERTDRGGEKNKRRIEMSQFIYHMTHQIERALRIGQIKLQRTVIRLGLPNYTLFAVSAVLTGALAGLAAVAFHDTIEFFHDLFFSRSHEVIGFLENVQVILLPAIGMLIQSGMIALWPEIAKRKGVMEVIKAVAVRGGYIPLRVTVFHLLAPAICIGSGGTVGPEGPAAQIGAGVASRFSRMLGLSDNRRRIFTAAGSGAAIAAIFNTPLGGVFFALEIALLNDFQASTFSALLLASVTASAISRVLLGNEPAFALGEMIIGPYRHMFLYGLLGLAAGALAVLFIRYSDRLHEIIRKKIFPRYRQPFVMVTAGLLVGVAGFFFHDILGIGYVGINRLLAGETIWQLALILLALKFILVPLVLESGGFGGIFAPSLFLGAMLGFLFAGLVNLLAPVTGVIADPSTFALVGMGSVLSALNSIPLTAIMIIFEMSNDYSFILPLMLGVVSSTIVTHVVIRESVYARKLRTAGYRFSAGRDVSILQRMSVAEVMRPGDLVILEEDQPLDEMLKVCIESPHEVFYTKNRDGTLTGTISTAELRHMITEYENLKQSRLVAKDVAVPRVVTVADNDGLDQVMRLFGRGTADELPVVSHENPRVILGSIRRQDVINAYNKESLKQNLTEGVASSLRTLEKTGRVGVTDGYSLIEKVAPLDFVGKTLADLKLRTRYHVEVIMIRRPQDPLHPEAEETAIMPDVKYKIQEGDTLVLFGEDDKLEALEKL